MPQPVQYELRVETDGSQQAARLHLHSADGVHLASHGVQLSEHSRAFWEGLFDTRAYVERYQGGMLADGRTEPATAEQLLARLGLFLGQQVLGREILAELAASRSRRTLLVHLPDTKQDVLAAAFARVPWEIARAGLEESPLLERHLVVRMISEETAKGDALVMAAANRVAEGEPLRVLLVFAEAPGSRPLAMRLERERCWICFIGRFCPSIGYRWTCSVME